MTWQRQFQKSDARSDDVTVYVVLGQLGAGCPALRTGFRRTHIHLPRRLTHLCTDSRQYQPFNAVHLSWGHPLSTQSTIIWPNIFPFDLSRRHCIHHKIQKNQIDQERGPISIPVRAVGAAMQPCVADVPTDGLQNEPKYRKFVASEILEIPTSFNFNRKNT